MDVFVPDFKLDCCLFSCDSLKFSGALSILQQHGILPEIFILSPFLLASLSVSL